MLTENTFARIFFLVVIIMAASLSNAPAGEKESPGATGQVTGSAHLLDGQIFVGPTGEKGKKTHHIDELKFQNGKFTSSKCFEFGFTGGPYTATVEGDMIHFQAETISPTHGKMVWTGTLKGDSLEVNYNWTKERWFWTTYREYWFKGTLEK